MNWDAIGAISEMLGAIAVFATLVFLTMQIRVSNNLARSSTSYQIMGSFGDLNETPLYNPHIADLLAKTKKVDSEYSPSEQVQIEHWCYRLFNIHVQAYTANITGNIDRAYYEGIRQDVAAIPGLYPGLIPTYNNLLDRYPAFDYDLFDAIREAGQPK